MLRGCTKIRDVWMRELNVSFLASGLFQEPHKEGGDLGYIYICFSRSGRARRETKEL